MADPKNYYAAFDVPSDASAVEIKARYRRWALELHPDRNRGSKQAEERFKDISQIYEILGDSIRRAQYDLYGVHGTKPIFEHLFNGAITIIDIPIGHRPVTLEEGHDIWVEYIRTPFTYDRRMKCERCKGKGYYRGSSCMCSWGRTKEFPNSSCANCHGTGIIVKAYCTQCQGRGYYVEPTVMTVVHEEMTTRQWHREDCLGDYTGAFPGDLYYRFVGEL